MTREIRCLLTRALCVVLTTVTCFAATPPVRVMPLGDSLVSGCCNSFEGGFRPRLYTLLVNAGFTVDFVGTEDVLSNNPSLPDPDHEGLGGYEIGALDAIVEHSLAAVDEPDVILLLIGTNDFAGNNDVANAKNRLENLIAHVAVLRPHAKIIVSNLLLREDLPAADQQIQTLFNPYIPGIVDHQVSLGRQVYFVDLRSALGPADFVDGLHPSVVGYNKMADGWFQAISNVITPLGTPNPPAIISVKGQVDRRHVQITFSKPVEDAAATVSNFGLSGGLSISAAELDPATKRTVTLTTSQQSLNTLYTVTVNGVRDRTPQHNTIASNSTGSFRSADVNEAVNYELVYSLKIPDEADFNWRNIPYLIDKSGSVDRFTRVAYYLELQAPGGASDFVWVSMNSFTTDATKIGVPNLQSGAFFQQNVGNMNIRSSLLTAVNGVGGRLEFWPGDYGTDNEANAPNASGTLYDFGDSSAPGVAGYGSMQVHNTSTRTTVFAFNGWGGAGLRNDVGIGQNGSGHPDWTFEQNAGNYTSKLLQVYVLPGTGTPFSPVIHTQPSNLSATVGSTAVFTVSATGPGNLSYQWRFNGQAISGATGSSYTINNIQASHEGSYDVVVSNVFGPTTSTAAVLTLVQNGFLANGSFESGYSAWMASGNQALASNGSFYQASHGFNLIVFNGGNSSPDGLLTHSFVSTAGQAYRVEFDLGVLSFNNSEQRLQVAGEGSRTLFWPKVFSIFGNSSGVSRWLPQSFTFIADSGTTTLGFMDVSSGTSGIDLLLDNVRVSEVLGSFVVASHIFYNRSSWDGNNAAANGSDDLAIAADKQPLHRGEVATFANYTSYNLGINGIMVDIANLPGTVTTSDFTFKVGNNNTPSSWSTGPSPLFITRRQGEGVNGSDRITLIWQDSFISKKWLEVTVLATPNTGLTSPSIFYFGNAVGEAGNSPNDAKVDPADELLARANQRTVFNPAAITFPYDFNRDQRVDPGDQLLARANQTTVFNALNLINLTGLGPSSFSQDQSVQHEPKRLARLNTAPVLESLPQIEPGAGWRSTWLVGDEGLILELSNPTGIPLRLETTESLDASWSSDGVPAPLTQAGAFTRWILPFHGDARQRFYRLVPAGLGAASVH